MIFAEKVEMSRPDSSYATDPIDNMLLSPGIGPSDSMSTDTYISFIAKHQSSSKYYYKRETLLEELIICCIGCGLIYFK